MLSSLQRNAGVSGSCEKNTVHLDKDGSQTMHEDTHIGGGIILIIIIILYNVYSV